MFYQFLYFANFVSIYASILVIKVIVILSFPRRKRNLRFDIFGQVTDGLSRRCES